MGESELHARFAATLAEARRQLAARRAQDDPASWWDVAEGAPSPLPPGLLPASASNAPTSSSPSAAAAPPPASTTAPAHWRQEEWHIAFSILFFEAPPGAWPGGDDLLFFVLADAWGGAGQAGFGGGGRGRHARAPPSPLLVRRRGVAPPTGLGLGGPQARTIDWAASTALNLVSQGGYRLGLVAARRGDLAGLGVPAALAAAAASTPKGAASAPAAAPPGAVLLDQAVHATPMRVAVEVGSGGRGGSGGGGGGGRTVGGSAAAPPAPASREPEVSYPDVCFEVGSGGGSGGGRQASSTAPLILSAPGDAFAVFLISHGAVAGAGAPSVPPFTELFAGFVTYEQLVGALCGPRRGAGAASNPAGGLAGLLFGGGGARRAAAAPPPPEHVRMRGPGGAGAADVAVTVLPPEGVEEAAAAGPPPPRPSGLLARAAAAALGSGPPPPPPAQGPPRFACSLFRLSLPIAELTARLCADAEAEGKET